MSSDSLSGDLGRQTISETDSLHRVNPMDRDSPERDARERDEQRRKKQRATRIPEPGDDQVFISAEARQALEEEARKHRTSPTPPDA